MTLTRISTPTSSSSPRRHQGLSHGRVEVQALRAWTWICTAANWWCCSPVRQRQIDAAEYPRRPGYADCRVMCTTGVAILLAGQRARLTDYRRYHVGFVFQFYNLIPVSPRARTSPWSPRSHAHRCARRQHLTWSASAIAWITSLPSFPAASNSAWPSRARCQESAGVAVRRTNRRPGFDDGHRGAGGHRNASNANSAPRRR